MILNNNPYFNDCYFSDKSGLDESLYVFIDGNNLPEVLKNKDEIHIAETGFGTGLNLMALLSVIPVDITTNIVYSSVELYPLSPEKIRSIISAFIPKLDKSFITVIQVWEKLYSNLISGWNHSEFTYNNVNIKLNIYIGDILSMLKDIKVPQEIWFLDGHSPDKNPEMWSQQVLSLVGEKSSEYASLATYTAAGTIKHALRNAGFFIKRRKGFGKKHHMIQGWKKNSSQMPL